MNQCQCVAFRGVDPLRGEQQVLQGSEHQRQRRPKFSADIAEELGLGAVKFGQQLGAIALLFVRAGFDECGGDLPRR